MYNLREVAPLNEGLTTNTELIGSYTVVMAQLHPMEFSKILASGDFYEPGSIFGFVVSNNGADLHILRERREYYVMKDNGKTFERIVNLK